MSHVLSLARRVTGAARANEPSGTAALGEWCAPVVTDCVQLFYGDFLATGRIADRDRLTMIFRKHCRLWVCLLEDRDIEANTSARDLARLAREVGLAAADLEAIDSAVAAELLDVILMRFGRSRGQAHGYGMTLMRAVERLARVHAAV